MKVFRYQPTPPLRYPPPAPAGELWLNAQRDAPVVGHVEGGPGRIVEGRGLRAGHVAQVELPRGVEAGGRGSRAVVGVDQPHGGGTASASASALATAIRRAAGGAGAARCGAGLAARSGHATPGRCTAGRRACPALACAGIPAAAGSSAARAGRPPCAGRATFGRAATRTRCPCLAASAGSTARSSAGGKGTGVACTSAGLRGSRRTLVPACSGCQQSNKTYRCYWASHRGTSRWFQEHQNKRFAARPCIVVRHTELARVMTTIRTDDGRTSDGTLSRRLDLGPAVVGAAHPLGRRTRRVDSWITSSLVQWRSLDVSVSRAHRVSRVSSYLPCTSAGCQDQRPRKLISQVIAGLRVPLLCMIPELVSQVRPTT